MGSTIAESIDLARGGNLDAAQETTVRLLQEQPDNAQGWYLLSQLVDSDARRAIYLNKTLELDPLHERAWAEFYAMPLPVVNALQSSDPGTTQSAGTAVAAAASVPPEEALPGWLIPLAGDQPITPTPTKSPETFSDATTYGDELMDAPDSQQDSGNRGLSLLLIVLVIATIFVLAFLAYLLLQG